MLFGNYVSLSFLNFIRLPSSLYYVILGLRYISENLNMDRVVLLSGQDYLIKEQKYIYSFLRIIHQLYLSNILNYPISRDSKEGGADFLQKEAISA